MSKTKRLRESIELRCCDYDKMTDEQMHDISRRGFTLYAEYVSQNHCGHIGLSLYHYYFSMPESKSREQSGLHYPEPQPRGGISNIPLCSPECPNYSREENICTVIAFNPRSNICLPTVVEVMQSRKE